MERRGVDTYPAKDSNSDEKGLYEKILEILNLNLEDSSNSSVRWLAWRVKIGAEIVEKFWWDNCPTFAASLAYTTLLALAPLLAVSLSILSSFNFTDPGNPDLHVDTETALEFFFEQFLPPNPDLVDSVKGSFATFKTNAAPVSLFGTLFLVALVIWVLSIIESAFNMIWKVDKPRPIFNQFVAYWATVTFAPVLIGLSIYFTAKMQALAASTTYAQQDLLQAFLMKGTPYFLTCVAFLLIYRLIPNTSVYLKPALYGAFIAGALFEVAKYIFSWYLREWASYRDVYGGLAIVPIFLFWLYVTWLIVLGGSVVAYAIQYPKEVKSKKKEGFDRGKFPHYYAVRILLEAARSFLANKGPLDPFQVQQKLEITSEFYSEILRKLLKLDMIVLLDSSGERFVIKKPMENIKISELMSKLNGEMLATAPEPNDGDKKSVETLFSDLRLAMERGIENLNLLGLAERMDIEAKERKQERENVVELHSEKAEQATEHGH